MPGVDMETLQQQLPTLGPSLGVVTLLAWLLVRLHLQQSSDRGGYRAEIAALREQHAAELAEMAARYQAQINDLQQQVTGLREEVRDLRAQLEAERRARWRAEDSAADYRRKLALASKTGKPPASSAG